MNITRLLPISLILGLAACSSAPKKSTPPPSAATGVHNVHKGARVQSQVPTHVATGCPSASPYAPAQEDPSTRGHYTAGGLYKPGVKDTTPDYVPNVACIPEPLVSNEPYSAVGNRSPYEVLGKRYKVMDGPEGYVERGTASYYGSKFHGRLTSNKEVYDMYAFTAAHKTLPLPSFALVTNVDTGQSVVVRVNDRGPFHDGRVIDLSYAAAVKLGITSRGTGNVEVRGLTEADNADLLAKRRAGGSAVPAAATMVAAARVAPRNSQIDTLVGQLPAKTSVVPARKVAAATPAVAALATTSTTAAATQAAVAPGERWRYRVADSKAPGSADNFDAWMKTQGVRVATGKPTRVAPAAAAPVVAARSEEYRQPAARVVERTATPVVAAQVKPAAPIAATALAPAPAYKPPSAAESALGSILLQVASFASRENANRALSQLASAGIVGATISDIASGGRTLWRLRVNARDHDNASELASRIASMGFGRPQIVAN